MSKTAPKTPVKVRAYQLVHHANEGKIEQLRYLVRPWRLALGGMQSQLYRSILEGKGLLKRIPLKPSDLAFETSLSSRQINSVHSQTRGVLSSWQELVKIAVRDLITNSSLDDETKTVLYRVNVRCEWFAKQPVLPMSVNNVTGEVKHGEQKGKSWSKADDLIVDQTHLKLLRHMVKKVRNTSARLPNLKRVNSLSLDGKIAVIERAEKDSAFDYWLRVSTLNSGKPVRIPLRSNKYFERADGVMSGFVQLNIKGNELRFTLQKKSEAAEPRTSGESLGLDFGLKSLFATSDGRLLGQGMFAHIQELDKQLITLQRALQKQNISRKSNKRYQALQRRIREYVKNEIHRVLNSLSREDIAELVVEKLDFRGAGLSRELNRVLGRFGRGVITKKLDSLHEDYGITVTEVNAAYSSQECDSCSHVSKKNRVGTKFSCRFCGLKSHADINAARVIVKRRSLLSSTDSSSAYQRGHLYRILEDRFQQRWNCSPDFGASSGGVPPLTATGDRLVAA